MRYLVTGAAGFIGSHLCEALLAEGEEVVGLDAFIPYYPRAIKERNLRDLLPQARFRFVEADLRDDDLAPALDGVEVIFHLAAMGGLRPSWTSFEQYLSCNVLGTQRLLEATRATGTVRQLIYGSTSSIYGRYVTGPETTPARPASPYGITKLAAEHLVQAYAGEGGLPATIVRYYSVYGPRQRPDMGYYIFIDRLLRREAIVVDGDGSQRRGNTYVADAVRATLLAQRHFEPGAIYNVGGAEEVSAIEVIRLLEEIVGQPAILRHGPPRPGEQERTLADIGRARQRLGFAPSVSLRDGLTAQVAWQRDELLVASG